MKWIWVFLLAIMAMVSSGCVGTFQSNGITLGVQVIEDHKIEAVAQGDFDARITVDPFAAVQYVSDSVSGIAELLDPFDVLPQGSAIREEIDSAVPPG